jgi:nitrosocyanin
MPVGHVSRPRRRHNALHSARGCGFYRPKENPTMKALSLVVLGSVLLGPGLLPALAEDKPADVALTIVNVEYEGTKIWVPSTIVARKGQTVRLTLINKVPSDPNQHGFAIPAVGVAEVVTRGETKTVTFTADKEGVFPTSCQLHPAHVGGQLVVLP